MFREESEGYGKLITELGCDPLTGVDDRYVLKAIQSLIGKLHNVEYFAIFRISTGWQITVHKYATREL